MAKKSNRTQEVVVTFRPKSSFQKDDCINQSKEFKCHRESILEAVARVGNHVAQIRCCDTPKCKHQAASMARASILGALASA